MFAVGDIPNDCSRSNVDAVRKETTEIPAGFGLQEPETKYVQGVAVAGSAYSRLCTLPSRTYVGANRFTRTDLVLLWHRGISARFVTDGDAGRLSDLGIFAGLVSIRVL